MNRHNDLYSSQAVRSTARALKEMARLALAFGRVNRTGPCHPNGEPESDTDHTVMLGWVAPSLADLINDRMGFQFYDLGKVAMFALVHDAPEVYAGDTCTIRVTDSDLMDKEEREALATARLHKEFYETLPWFAKMVVRYEEQKAKEARFVRAVDKVLPKMVHLVDERIGLKKERVSRAEFLTLVARQRQQVSDNTPNAGHYFIMAIYDLLCTQVLTKWPEDEPLPPAGPQLPMVHSFLVSNGVPQMNHVSCGFPADGFCPYSLAFSMYMRNGPEVRADGEYEVFLDERNELQFGSREAYEKGE